MLRQLHGIGLQAKCSLCCTVLYIKKMIYSTSIPWLSKPLRPARPAICSSSLWVRVEGPSSRRRDTVESTVLRAGMLIPAARVSVANTSFSRPAHSM